MGRACKLIGAALLLAGLAGIAAVCFPWAFGMDALEVATGSMAPGIMPGDTAYVARDTAFQQGDVVLFRRGDGLEVLHRAVLVRGGTVVTKGDANPVPDAEAVSEGDVAGRMLFSLGPSEKDMAMATAGLSACLGACLALMGWAAPARRQKGDQ